LLFTAGKEHTMDPELFLRGLAIGFGIAAAVGPISVLTIRRTLASGFVVGLASGLGVAAADASYGAIAAFGITAVTDVLVGARDVLGLVGGAFLVWLGVRTLVATPALEPATLDAAADPSLGGTAVPSLRRRDLATAFLTIYGLTMTNPMTILSFAAIFAGLGVAGSGPIGAVAVTVGVFLGSTIWWLVLTSAVSLLRVRITPRGLRIVNIGSGLLVAGFGVVALVTTVAG
jgi:threonine/homoserine/homoserine lactone efflux protein